MRNNSYNSDYLANTLASNISFQRKWDNKPYYLSLNFRHNQNTLTKQIDLTMPELSFTVNRVFPFKKLIKKTWYKNLGISYSLNAKNKLSRPDSLLFNKISQNLQNGATHSIPLSTSFNIFKYININPSILYNENWFFKQSNGLNTDTTNGFWSVRNLRFTTQFSTKIYGFISTKNKQFRHVFTPTISYSYKPDLSQDYFSTLIGAYSNSNATKQNRLNFTFSNNLEMKFNEDNNNKKIKLIDNLSISGYYDHTLEDFNMSYIDVNLRTKLFDKLNFKLNSSFDPYEFQENVGRINNLLINSGRIGRLTNFNFDISMSFKDQKKEIESKERNSEDIDYINQNIDQYVDFNVPWSLNVFYNFNYTKPDLNSEIMQSINFNGDVSITKNWKIGFRSGYDFKNKEFTYTSIDLYRDLHCWEMMFNWIPLGFHQSYNFVIKVKSSLLQDLKLTKKRDFYDY